MSTAPAGLLRRVLGEYQQKGVSEALIVDLEKQSPLGRVLAAALIQQGLALAPRLSLRAADQRAAAFWEANGFIPDSGGTRRSHLLAR